MQRKAKVTQGIVNDTCQELFESGKNITVNAVINAVGGSFSTVGTMVKLWKEELATQAIPVITMPDTVSKAMEKATTDIWTAASSLTSQTIEKIQKEAEEMVVTAKNDLSEYSGEVSRLEAKLEEVNQQLTLSEEKLTQEITKTTEISAQNKALETRLSDRDKQLKHLQANYENLQAELVIIAKNQAKEIKTQSKKKK